MKRIFLLLVIVLVVLTLTATSGEKQKVYFPEFEITGEGDPDFFDEYYELMRKIISEKFEIVQENGNYPDLSIKITYHNDNKALFYLNVQDVFIGDFNICGLDLTKDLIPFFKDLGEAIVLVLSLVPEAIEGEPWSQIGVIEVSTIPGSCGIYLDGNLIPRGTKVKYLDLNTEYTLILTQTGFKSVVEKIILTEKEPTHKKQYNLKLSCEAIFGIRPPMLRKKAIFAYPLESRENEDEGEVVVILTLDVNGKVVSSELGTSSGYELLDSAALDAAEMCEFLPAETAGFWFGDIDVELRFIFKLE